MSKEIRTSKIQEIISREEPIGKIEIMWMERLVPMDVFQVPLEFLIYNKYNGRILSRTKSLETHGHTIDPESEEGAKLIEKLLWLSKKDRNEKTLQDLGGHGQQKVGTITKDGIIIDGNRRAMLLNRLGKKYFKAVILPVELEHAPLEIQRLETSIQMGEDEKLGYNPVEKYLKAKDLSDKQVEEKDIAEWMGESIPEIKKYLEVMKTMENYLDYFKYSGIYTQLDEREDQFISLTKWLNSFRGTQSARGFDGYREEDVDELERIAFEYIRAKFEGKKFRVIADGNRGNHFFGDKNIWSDFSSTHDKQISPLLDQEQSINYDSPDIATHLSERDRTYAEMAYPLLDENMDEYIQRIRYKKHTTQPLKLVEDAALAIESIDRKQAVVETPDFIKKVEYIKKASSELLAEKSPVSSITDMINTLQSIDLKKHAGIKEELLQKISELNSVTFVMKKDLGG